MPELSQAFVFVSYSHKDKRWLERLKTHLKPILRELKFSVWDDSKIQSGTHWRQEIREAITNAHLAVLLVSPDFLASDFISENELSPLLDKAEEEGLIVFWIAVRESAYKKTAIELYQAANDPSKPLASLKAADRDSELVRICEKLEQALKRVNPDPTIRSSVDSAGEKERQKRVVFLYKRNLDPDGQILQFLTKKFIEREYDVFVDHYLSAGVKWAAEINRQIRSSDAVIPLLSSSSVESEMLTSEIQVAQEASQQQDGKPRLIPVRVLYEGPLPESISHILDPLPFISWTTFHDNDALADELLGMLSSPREGFKAPKILEPVGGAVSLDSVFYLRRKTDEDFALAIERQDSIVLIKGARQIGKTSLLARGLDRARKRGAKVVLTDFQALSAYHLESPESLFRALSEMIADQLELETAPSEVWNINSGPSINFQRYLRRYVFTKFPTAVVWGLDEVDRLFTCDFGSEVFGLFRSWHNARSLDPTGPWHRLTLAIAYATEAHLFITNMNQSPFNVGTQFELEDFTYEEVHEMNHRYGSPLKTSDALQRYYTLVQGHPYLVREGLHQMVVRNIDLLSFEREAGRDGGPLGSHLRRVLVSLAQDKSNLEDVRRVLSGKLLSNDESFYRLRSAGVLKGSSREDARLRCEVYATYLAHHLL